MERPELGLGDIMVLQYISIFRNPDGMIYDKVKNTDAPLPVKLIQRWHIEVMSCTAHTTRGQSLWVKQETDGLDQL